MVASVSTAIKQILLSHALFAKIMGLLMLLNVCLVAFFQMLWIAVAVLVIILWVLQVDALLALQHSREVYACALAIFLIILAVISVKLHRPKDYALNVPSIPFKITCALIALELRMWLNAFHVQDSILRILVVIYAIILQVKHFALFVRIILGITKHVEIAPYLLIHIPVLSALILGL